MDYVFVLLVLQLNSQQIRLPNGSSHAYQYCYPNWVQLHKRVWMSLPEIVIKIHMLKFIKLKIPPGINVMPTDVCKPGVSRSESRNPESSRKTGFVRSAKSATSNQSSQIFIRWPGGKWTGTGIQFYQNPIRTKRPVRTISLVVVVDNGPQWQFFPILFISWCILYPQYIKYIVIT